ncbi:hypothetical protein HC235_10725 [Pyrobaculum arsenaticum]|uniref:Uncharacterized protein n=2 Tax=Pyrobaculum arsenaticum TaxID=121277 RepID=A4WLH1_PYRAR|nr:hypothetical protein Pars_1687 [Pyrobaculum arsenaticum DSM 13514]NYR16393.1 hypothetical protein [Pyrobaculum arsenaticum]
MIFSIFLLDFFAQLVILFLILRGATRALILVGVGIALVPPIMALAAGICNVPPMLACFSITPTAAELAALVADASVAAIATLAALARRYYIETLIYITSLILYVYIIVKYFDCILLLEEICREKCH